MVSMNQNQYREIDRLVIYLLCSYIHLSYHVTTSVRGDVKIFDFGLARFLPEGGDPYNDTFEKSGAGSPRYMAPECLDEDKYNMKADVYTFALVFWEMLTGQAPYSFLHTWENLYYYVVEKGHRPEIKDEWPVHIQGMLESSFDADQARRPKMLLFYKVIRNALLSLRGGDIAELSHSHIHRRRSDASFNASCERLGALSRLGSP